MNNVIETSEVKQELCKECGGIKKVLADNREIKWTEATTHFEIAPDAWCICG